MNSEKTGRKTCSEVSTRERSTSFLANKKICQHSISTFDKIAIGLSEFFATIILVFVACMGCVPGVRSETVLVQQVAAVSGLAVMITIFLFGHVSGAHVNPLTTICALIVGQIPLVLVPIYLVGEVAGAVTGYGLLMLVTPEVHMRIENGTTRSSHGVCTTVPSTELTSLQAVAVEILLSLVLSFANCSSWDYRNASRSDSAPLKFGFLVAALVMAGGPYTGASMNPAKSFAPALWNNDWERHWVYWVGPLTAAVSAATCYRAVFLRSKPHLGVDDSLGV